MKRENYLRVTETLYPFSGLQNIDQEIVQKAARRGTKVHKICEAIASGLGEMGVTDEVKGYIDSFKIWWGEGRKIAAMEERFWDDTLFLTGQVDFILEEPEGLVICDLKTSYAPSKTWMPQGCAYAYLAKSAGYPIKGIKFIHLNKQGKPPKVHTYEMDETIFLACLLVYTQFFATGETWKKNKQIIKEKLSSLFRTETQTGSIKD